MLLVLLLNSGTPPPKLVSLVLLTSIGMLQLVSVLAAHLDSTLILPLLNVSVLLPLLISILEQDNVSHVLLLMSGTLTPRTVVVLLVLLSRMLLVNAWLAPQLSPSGMERLVLLVQAPLSTTLHANAVSLVLPVLSTILSTTFV